MFISNLQKQIPESFHKNTIISFDNVEVYSHFFPSVYSL